MSPTGNIPLFLVGGINNPAQHSTMVNLFSATSAADVSGTKAMLSVAVFTSPVLSAAPTVSGDNIGFVTQPYNLYSLSHPNSANTYGPFDRSHYRPDVDQSGSAVPFQGTTGRENISLGSTWFDPGLRLGGVAVYGNVPVPNHVGATDDRDNTKGSGSRRGVTGIAGGGWRPGMSRHADQFFIRGVPGNDGEDLLPNTHGLAFFQSRWGTPASYFFSRDTQILSTRALEPIYFTQRRLATGIEPWSVDSGNPIDFHLTLWVRPLSANDNSGQMDIQRINDSPLLRSNLWDLSAEVRPKHSPLFSIGKG